MNRRQSPVTDIRLARIMMVISWIFFALLFISGLAMFDQEPPETVLGIFFILTAVMMVFVVLVFRNLGKLVKDFRYYAKVLVNDKSITNLSENVGEPKEAVTKKLRTMCRRGYFVGHVDEEKDCLVLTDDGGTYAAICPGCGAKTTIYKTGDCCQYCGNPLIAHKEEA